MKVRGLLMLGAIFLLGCSSPKETPRVEVSVVADSSGIQPVVTNLEYEVSLTAVDVAIRDIEFMVSGEVATSFWDRVSDAVVSKAWAHPGHYQGGDVTGELLGSFVLHFEPDRVQSLGTAILLEGDYHSVNFFFRREEGGILDGHSASLRGTAMRDDAEVQFEIVLDSPDERRLEGAPFEYRVEEGAELVVGLRLLVQDLLEGDTLFDDVDFLALDRDSDGHVDIRADSEEEASISAYNQIHRKLQSHDHFDLRVQN